MHKKITIPIIASLLFSLTLCLGVNNTYSQGKQTIGILKIRGQVLKSNGKNFPEVTVKLYEKSELSKKITTNKAGKFKFDLTLNSEYTIIVTKSGYISKTIDISTKVPEKYLDYVFDYDFKVQLLQPLQNKVDVKVNQPAGLILWNNELDRFDYDKDLTLAYKKHLDSLQRAQKQMKEKTEQTKQAKRSETKESTEKEEPVMFKEEEKTTQKEISERKQEQKQEARQHKGEKSKYEKKMIEEVAESEKERKKRRLLKQEKLEEQREAAIHSDTNTVKGKQENYEKEKQQEQKAHQHKAEKTQHNYDIRVTIAEKEREKRMKAINEGNLYKSTTKDKPTVSVEQHQYLFKSVDMILIQYPHQKDTLKKVTWRWGTIYYYKNNQAINKEEFQSEINKYDLKGKL